MTDASQAIAIYVDADACPVKNEIYKVAERHRVKVFVVANAFLMVPQSPLIERVVVSSGFDAADDWIAERARRGTIVITADIPLAARAVALGAHVLGPTGRPFTPETIGMAVAMRDLKQHLRETGEIKGHNAGFTREDLSRFLGALDHTVVSTSLATIAGDLGALEHMGWVVVGYALASTVLLPVIGKLGDTVGPRSVFLTSLVAFLAASVLCGFAPSMTWLIVARVIQGMGDRASKPFVTVNCAAIPADLVESTLFGHRKGTFTGATAHCAVACRVVE